MDIRGSVTVGEVVEVLKYLGGEADSSEIKNVIVSRRGDTLPTGYENWNSYRNTIDQLIQYHCPQCKKFLRKDILFEQVARGRYKLAESQECERSSSLIPSPTSKIVERITEEADELVFPEGKEIYRLHRTKERNPSVVEIAKRNRLESDPLLRCEICDFSFVENYGDLGRGFIEAHHTTPVSQLSEEIVTKVSDIALVCSNCHRMLHRHRPWRKIDELRTLLTSKAI
jgi:hypothetical protein